MDYDKEFKHKLSQIITKNIFPATIKWDLPNVIFIRQKEKCVYVVKIEESPYFDKPHMFYDHQEGSAQIPIRRPGGHLDFIKDGKELRDFFLMEDKFYPQYEKHVRYILEKIKNTTNANISLLEIIIFEKFKAYLEKRQVAIYQDREDVGFLLESINRLQDLITRVNRTFSNIGMNTDYGEYIKVKKELDLEIDNFLNNSENIYE
mgnify:FL=1